MIFDSNIIIYSVRPEYPGLLRLLRRLAPSVSAISVVEVLGFHKLAAADRADFETFFAATELLPITDDVIGQAVTLRQARKMSLGDAIIAATALVFGHELYTHNVKDFINIPGLVVIDPIAAGDPP